MDIRKEIIDDLNAVVSVKIAEEDYQKKVEDVLKDYKKKATLDGFRPGMVPMGIVKKLYYRPVLADEINKIVAQSLMNYIRDEKLRILGEPLPHIDNAKQIDFDSDKEFEFSFDLGLVQDFTLNINSKDKIPFYTIKVENDAVEEYLENIRKRSGEFVPTDTAKEDEMIKGSLKQAENESTLTENGIELEETSFSIAMIKDDDIKKQFIGSKAGDRIVFEVKKAFPDEADLAGFLRIDRTKVKGIKDPFEFIIKEILKFEKHAVDQALFDKVYGEGRVKTEEEFREKLIEELKNNYEYESNFRFAIDAKKYLINKAKLRLPVGFLKRWILATNDKITSEQIDNEFSEYEEEFQWQLIKDQLIRENEISVSDEELLEYTAQLARNQFYQYGLYNVEDDYIVNYAREQLTHKEEARRLRDQKYEERIMKFMKETVKLDKKEISREKFRKLFEK